MALFDFGRRTKHIRSVAPWSSSQLFYWTTIPGRKRKKYQKFAGAKYWFPEQDEHPQIFEEAAREWKKTAVDLKLSDKIIQLVEAFRIYAQSNTKTENKYHLLTLEIDNIKFTYLDTSFNSIPQSNDINIYQQDLHIHVGSEGPYKKHIELKLKGNQVYKEVCIDGKLNIPINLGMKALNTIITPGTWLDQLQQLESTIQMVISQNSKIDIGLNEKPSP